MKKVLLALMLMAALAGCNTGPRTAPPMVDGLDLDRFLGKWYVMGSMPNWFDRNPYNATETFERADRGINITYQFNAGAPDGELKTVTGHAMIDNPGINTDWHMRVSWPFGSDFRIVYLEPDYSVAVIGQANRKNVHILSRRPRISEPVYSDIILQLQAEGYNVGKIRTVPHQ